MTRIEWGRTGERFFETGVSRGVLYPTDKFGAYPKGVAWTGLTAVNESPSGAEATKEYADNQVYLNMISAEEFSGTIEAFQSPVEFDQCDGSASTVPGIRIGQQTRRAFGFSYQTLIGNDIDGQEHGYKVHVVYGALAAPSERNHETVNDSPEPVTLSWEFNTTPANITPEIKIDGKALKPVSTLSFDSRYFSAAKMQELTDILYGTESSDARLPSPFELITLMGLGQAVEVTPTAPTFDDVSDTLTIPTVLGVSYFSNGAAIEPGDHVIEGPTLVTSVPKIGYAFPKFIQTQWAFTPTE